MSLVVAAVTTLLVVLGSPGLAQADPGTDPDGASTQSLREKLEAAARGYYDAQAVLNASKQRQAEITQKLQVAQAGLAHLTEEVGKVAAARYKGSSIGLLSGLITGRAQPEELLAGAAVGEYLVWRDDTYIRQYREIKDEAERQQGLLTAELDIQSNTSRRARRPEARSREGSGRGRWPRDDGSRLDRPSRHSPRQQRRRQLPPRGLHDQTTRRRWLSDPADVPRSDRGTPGRLHPLCGVLPRRHVGRAPARPGV
jgi:hypothetical protein